MNMHIGAADSYKKITKPLREAGYWPMIDRNFGCEFPEGLTHG